MFYYSYMRCCISILFVFSLLLAFPLLAAEPEEKDTRPIFLKGHSWLIAGGALGTDDNTQKRLVFDSSNGLTVYDDGSTRFYRCEFLPESKLKCRRDKEELMYSVSKLDIGPSVRINLFREDAVGTTSDGTSAGNAKENSLESYVRLDEKGEWK